MWNVEKKQLIVSFFQISVDIHTKYDYYYVNCYSLRVAKGVGVYLGNIKIF